MKLLRLRISFVRVLGHVRKHEPTAFSMGKKQNKKNPQTQACTGATCNTEGLHLWGFFCFCFLIFGPPFFYLTQMQ